MTFPLIKNRILASLVAFSLTLLWRSPASAEDASKIHPAASKGNPVAIAIDALNALGTDRKPAIAVLVSRDGKVLLRHAVGMADIENNIPVTPETKFRIGSVTKQFTSAAILKLAEQGKLSVDDTLDKFLPDFPRGEDVTIEHLLHHTSGIPSYTDASDFMSTVTKPTTEEDLIATFAGQEFNFEPGTEFQYNNSGYFLLGHLVGKISGSSLSEFWQTEFFAPLEMNDTGFHTADAMRQNEGIGYSMVNGQIQPALNWDMSRAGGAGAIYSTLDDLMRWNEAVFTGRVLNAVSLAKAFTVSPVSSGAMNYGYGWSIIQTRGLTEISHNGGLQGWLSDLTRYRDQNINVVVLQNSMPTAYPGLEPEAITQQMKQLFLADDMSPLPVRMVDDSIGPDVLQRYVGRYDYGPAVMTITREDKQLTAQLTGQLSLKIYPEDERHFFWQAVDAQVEFLLDDTGKCIAARHNQGGQNFTADRLPDAAMVELSTAQLDRFTGRYDYGRDVMTIRREGKQLFAKLGGQPAFPIFPVDASTFRWRIVDAQVKFISDAENAVTGAEHTQNGTTFTARRLPMMKRLDE